MLKPAEVSKKLFKNQKYPSTLKKKSVQLAQFFRKKMERSSKNSMLMSELFPNENGFMGKNAVM